MAKGEYEKVIALKKEKPLKPLKPAFFWRFLIKSLAKKDLKETRFTYKEREISQTNLSHYFPFKSELLSTVFK